MTSERATRRMVVLTRFAVVRQNWSFASFAKNALAKLAKPENIELPVALPALPLGSALAKPGFTALPLCPPTGEPLLGQSSPRAGSPRGEAARHG